MKTRLFLVLSLTLLLASDKQKEDKEKKDSDVIQGTWKVVSVEQGGQKRDAEDDSRMVIIFKGEDYSVKMNGTEVEKGTVKIDPAKKPKSIDFAITEGNDKGKKQVGIYGLEDDTLKICVTQPEKDDRPKELVAKEGTDHILFVMKREKK
jgi:uncharacterized protein (TIGR03067 family)